MSVEKKYSHNEIWLTRKCRIHAEVRLKNNDVHSQALLVWYAILSSALAIFSIRYPHILGEDTDLYACVLSVALMVASLVVTSKDYRGRSLAFRANYLALQQLYSDLLSGVVLEKDKSKHYEELLSQCENHSNYDHGYFVLFGGSDEILSKWRTIVICIQIILRVCIFAILYTFPLFILFFLQFSVGG